jgi:hypothetical protein
MRMLIEADASASNGEVISEIKYNLVILYRSILLHCVHI